MKRIGRCLRGVFVVVVLLSAPSPGAQDVNKTPVSRTPAGEQCVENLHHIYKLIKSYLHHSGQALGWPSLDDLHLMTRDRKWFICPADKDLESAAKSNSFRDSYEIAGNPLDPKLAETPPGRIAIVVEKRANHSGSRFVLFYDGSVRKFDERRFSDLKSNSFIDATSTR